MQKFCCTAIFRLLYRVCQVLQNTYYRWNITFISQLGIFFLLHVNMSELWLNEETILVLAYWLKYFNLQIATFCNLAQSFVINVKRELKYASFHMANVSCRKRHCQWFEIINTLEFTSQVGKKLTKLMRALVGRMQVDETIFWWVNHENIH